MAFQVGKCSHMPFGLCDTPADFPSLIEKVICNINCKFFLHDTYKNTYIQYTIVTKSRAKPQQTPSVEKHAHPPRVVYCAIYLTLTLITKFQVSNLHITTR